MLNQQQVQDAAALLDQAEQNRTQVRATSILFPDMDIVDAYRIQDAWVQMKLGRGRQIKGRKIGLTSRAMQQAMRIDEPDYGTLLDDMFFASGSEIEAARFCEPGIEVELAFVMAEPLAGPDVGIADIARDPLRRTGAGTHRCPRLSD